MSKNLKEAIILQADYLKKGVSILVKHYSSGSYGFVVQIHNGDATGWTKVSPFLSKSCYSYLEALNEGFKWYKEYNSNSSEMEYQPDKDKEISNTIKIATGSDFGSIVKYE